MHFYSGEGSGMKLAGILLLLAGWGILLTAMVLFSAGTLRLLFGGAGACVETVGLISVFRGHFESGRPGS